ncbi:MAG: HK97 gp10 family phage protein [Mesorhizobium sp.]|nr:HK97 gp10 family phage protein [Mesorhizobium sp.]MCO5159816.1 HK97 gp10 family phage protein [Mesorhizobium sp.]
MARRSNDLSRILRKLDRLGKEPVEKMRAALQASAQEVVAAQKSVAPVDDGDLRDSIRTEAGDHPLQILVTAGGEATTRPVRDGVDASYDYSLGQEFGWSDNPEGNPFFFGPYRLLKRRVVGRVTRAGRRAIREVWDK